MPASTPAPVVTFLSDYGYADEFAGVCHSVIARRCPTARVIDLTHGIPRHDVIAGATVLQAALPYTPAGVHLAVVDPDVGALGAHARRAVALRTYTEDRLLVGPDTGLLMPAARAFGGAAEAVDIGSSPERLEPVSRTFHGRDIFAPVAGALAAGEPLAGVGEPISVRGLRELELPGARSEDGVLTVHVLRMDGFGNLILDAGGGQLAALGGRPGDTLEVRRADRSHAARYAATFADVPAGELLIYEDSQQALALAVNRGSAAELLGARGGDELEIRPA
jgi:S-adenosylmethionine hydrolase